jgi:predicted oxidoreductase
MKTIPLGKSSLSASRLAYGCWRLVRADGPEALTPEQRAAAREAVLAAYEAGYTLFDLADIYSRGAAEAALGAVLREVAELRERVVICTKGGIRFADEPPGAPFRYDFSAEHLLRACEGSLRRLGVETIDLYLLHRPDYLCDPEEVARAFVKLRESGKVRAFGVSNFRPAMLAMLQKFCPLPLVAHQVELSLTRLDPLEDGVLDQCRQEGITPQAWSPLGGGPLVGPIDASLPRDVAGRLQRLQTTLAEIARAHAVSPAAIALAWLLKHPAGIQPVVGSTRPERIRDAATADAVELSREEWYRLLEASRGRRLP